MVICIIALVVFGILGLFSTKYRQYAREAFHCFFRTVQLKPCDTDFEQKIKSKIISKLMRFPTAAKFIYNNFKAISWIFVITFFLSIAGIFYGFYQYYLYGNCNGPVTNGTNGGFCIYNGISNAISGTTMNPKDIVIGNHPLRGDPNANVTIIEFACLQCSYSKAAEPVVKQVLQQYDGKVNLAFFFFPLPQHLHGQLAARADYCAGEQGKFWEYHDILFDVQSHFNNNVTDEQALNTINSAAGQLNLNITQFSTCLNSDNAKQKVLSDIDLGNKLGLKGTPTFFIGGQELVGPQTFDTFKSILDKLV